MGKTNSQVGQSAAVIANLLKPLIQSDECSVKKVDELIRFTLREGSAQIQIDVFAHPAIDDDACVEVLALMGQADLASHPEIALALLAKNLEFFGFSFAYEPKHHLIGLRGCLIGSTMDKLEFEFLLSMLARSADDLDEALLGAIAQTGNAEPAAQTIADDLVQMANRVLKLLDDSTQELIESYVRTLDEDQRELFANSIADEEIRRAFEEVALGLPAAKLTTIILNDGLADAERRKLAHTLLESLPSHAVLLDMLAHVVLTTTHALAKSLNLNEEVLSTRLSIAFGK